MRLPSHQKVNMAWERGFVFSFRVKNELRSPTQVSHVKIKNKAKKLRKRQSFNGIAIDLWLHYHPIHEADRGVTAVGTMFHGAVSLLIADCVD